MIDNQAGGGLLSSSDTEFSADEFDRFWNKNMPSVITRPTATMARCPSGPDSPVLAMDFLLITFSPVCAVQDIMAQIKPFNSKTGEFQEAAAMPAAIGTRESNVRIPGNAPAPSSSNVRSTVKIGMAHLDV